MTTDIALTLVGMVLGALVLIYIVYGPWEE